MVTPLVLRTSRTNSITYLNSLSLFVRTERKVRTGAARPKVYTRPSITTQQKRIECLLCIFHHKPWQLNTQSNALVLSKRRRYHFDYQRLCSPMHSYLCHCVSLCITVYQCVSLCITVYHCVSLCYPISGPVNCEAVKNGPCPCCENHVSLGCHMLGHEIRVHLIRAVMTCTSISMPSDSCTKGRVSKTLFESKFWG